MSTPSEQHAAPASLPRQAPSWLRAREAGSRLGLQIVIFMATAFGRPAAMWLLRVIVFYYALFARRAMRASAQYLSRLERPHGFWDRYRHLLRFAECATDRFFFVTGKRAAFEIRTNGSEHLRAAQASGRGAVLLGAHLGSFEAMHAMGQVEGLVINVVGYFRNAQRINELLEESGRGGVHTRLLEVEPGNINFVLRLRQCIERGEMVALLADRAVRGDALRVDFLGAPANLPTGPYVLAAALKCPVYLTFGLFTAPNRYDLYCEPFADPLELPRASRADGLKRYAQQYADRLGHYCRLAPDNWFNFYDFWGGDA